MPLIVGDSDSEDDIIFIPPPSPPFCDLVSSSEDDHIEELENRLNKPKNNGRNDASVEVQIDHNSCDNSDNDVLFIAPPRPPLLDISSEDDNVDEPKSNRHESVAFNLQDTKVYDILTPDEDLLFASPPIYHLSSLSFEERVVHNIAETREQPLKRQVKRLTKRKSSGTQSGFQNKCLLRDQVANELKELESSKRLSSKTHCNKKLSRDNYTDINTETNALIKKSSTARQKVQVPDSVPIGWDLPDNSYFINENENWDDINNSDKSFAVNKSPAPLVGFKDVTNHLRVKAFVIHPESECNNERYDITWDDTDLTGEQQMTKNSTNWHVVHEDISTGYRDHFDGPRSENGDEAGHQTQFCPQPRDEMICGGVVGQMPYSTRCPNDNFLKCGAVTNASNYRDCNQCQHYRRTNCIKCEVRGHDQQNCPDSRQCYDNTNDGLSTPECLPKSKREKAIYCSVCARAGHTAENCFNDSRLFGKKMYSTEARNYHPTHETNDMELMFLNPMNPQNCRRKVLKNPFSKKHRKAASKRSNKRKNNFGVDVTEPIKPRIRHNTTTKIDIKMEKIERSSMTISDATKMSIKANAVMQEAVEVDQLKGGFGSTSSTIKSFDRNVDGLVANTSAVCQSEVNLNKVKESKIEKLTAIEHKLLKLRKSLTAMIKSETNIDDQIISTIIGSHNDYDERTRSTKPIIEKKLFLTQFHSQILAEANYDFLFQSTETNRIKVTFENENTTDTLVVVGTAVNQMRFRDDLVQYLEVKCKEGVKMPQC